MFDFIIEVNPEQLKDGIHEYLYADVTVVGNYGSLSSKDDNRLQNTMIFGSISDLLTGVTALVKKNKKQYRFMSIGSSFSFYITRKKYCFEIKDINNNLISRTTEKEFIQSIWKPINDFVVRFRPLFIEEEGIAEDLDDSIKNFKQEFKRYISN